MRMLKWRYSILVIGLLLAAFFQFGCASMSGPGIQPHEIAAPEPINGNSGEYMCPYTSDGVVAEWVDKAVNAKMGATVGKHAGAYAGQKALEQVPFIGGLLGQKAGEAVGRKIAIEASGGWDYIKETSDLSFNSVDNLAVYLYAERSDHSHYREVLDATREIYPELKERYHQAIIQAPRRE